MATEALELVHTDVFRESKTSFGEWHAKHAHFSLLLITFIFTFFKGSLLEIFRGFR